MTISEALKEARRRDAVELEWLGTTTQGRPDFAAAELLDRQGIPSCHVWRVPEGDVPPYLSATQALRRWQDGACAMCSARPNRLLVDHCHRSGLIRGLLCTSCNTAEGSSLHGHHQPLRAGGEMTVHEDAARLLLEDLHDDPDGAAMLARMTASLYEGSYSRQLIARVGQTQREPDYWPSHQVAALMHVLEGLAFGRIVRRRIPVGAAPGPDADRHGNAAKLDAVTHPFRVDLAMTQNGADCDGTLSWNEPVAFWRALGARVLHQKGVYGSLHVPFEVRPWSVPLEVGYTLPSRTAAHLLTEGAVARWAYDDEEICVLLDLPRLGAMAGTRPLPAGVKPFDPGL